MKRLICLLALLTLLPVAAWGEGLPRLADIPTLNAQGCPPPKRLTTPEEAAAQALAYAQSPLLNWRVPEDAALNARQDMDYDLDHVTVYITNFSDPLGLADETEALRGVQEAAFELLGLHRLHAVCAVDNQAMLRVLEKAGMRCEGRMVKRGKARPEEKEPYFDQFGYAILREEWQAAQKQA